MRSAGKIIGKFLSIIGTTLSLAEAEAKFDPSHY